MVARITLTARNGSVAGKTYELAGRRQYLIGRAEDCDVRLSGHADCCTVSRHHCLVREAGDAVQVRDLGSANGTHLNGMQIGRPARWQVPAALATIPHREYDLHDGDELRLGQLAFTVRLAPAAQECAPPEPAWGRDAERRPSSRVLQTASAG